jgi:hypothetical protein
MANIVISELHPAGAELFDGFDSFMMDLYEDELDVTGGAIWTVTSSKPCILGAAFVGGAIIGWIAN